MATAVVETPNMTNVGIELLSVTDLKSVLQNVQDEFGLSFIMTPLMPRDELNQDSLAFSDLCLSPDEWRMRIVGTLMMNSNVSTPIYKNRCRLFREMSWATYLGIPAVVVPAYTSNDEGNFLEYAHMIFAASQEYPLLQIWIRFTLDENTWKLWQRLHCVCDYSATILVMLDVSPDLPLHYENWLGENVAALVISTECFATQTKDDIFLPCLSPRHSQFVCEMVQRNTQLVLRDGECESISSLKPFTTYIEDLLLHNPIGCDDPDFVCQYRDFLQIPLQPLMNNLASSTYAVFERDIVKYELYQQAISKAMTTHFAKYTSLHVMVVGAGRGPLINAVLSAARQHNIEVKIIGIEKNPNAIITLRELKRDKWFNDDITLFHGDMRKLQGYDGYAHILVSELLGSFGDNELSPECLDGAQHFLRDNDGISIPHSYTSYLAPICSSALWTKIRHSTRTPLRSLETPHVVNLWSFAALARAQPCFIFHHPRTIDSIDDKYHHHHHHHNQRSCSITFTMNTQSAVHGFAAYFAAQLVDGVILSIEPSSHTPNMHSWFPMMFPIQSPLDVFEGDTITVHLSRCVDTMKRRVWYEWSASVSCNLSSSIRLKQLQHNDEDDDDGEDDDVHRRRGVSSTTSTHNINGRTNWIGL